MDQTKSSLDVTDVIRFKKKVTFIKNCRSTKKKRF